MRLRSRRSFVVLGIVALVAACGRSGGGGTAMSSGLSIGGVAESGGAAAWPAPPATKVAELTRGAGLALEHKESLIHHVHAHLDVFIDGAHRSVPSGIGIVITDAAVHTGTVDGEPAYGGIAGCDTPCISPLHTHDFTGVLHTESAVDVDNTLGQLFKEWDVRLTDTCIGSYCTPTTAIRLFVDGKAKALASASKVALTDHEEIAIVIGKPPTRIPSEGDFSGA